MSLDPNVAKGSVPFAFVASDRKRSYLLLLTLLFLYLAARILQLYAGRVPNLLIVVLHVLPPALFALIHGARIYRMRGILVFTALCLGMATFFESVSLRTGFPFGHYWFTNLMGPKLFDLPILLVLAYVGMGYLSWVVAVAILDCQNAPLSGKNVVCLPLLASFVMTAWDFSMDPVWADIDHAWVWRDGGSYYGVPVSNFAGWILTAYVFYQLFALYVRYRVSVPSPRGHWRLAILFYAASAAGNFLVVAPASLGTVFVDHAGKHWMISGILWACRLVSIFLMIPLGLIAWLKASKVDRALSKQMHPLGSEMREQFRNSPSSTGHTHVDLTNFGAKDCLVSVNSDLPSISVIIPAFNEERCLPSTLQAIQKSALLLRSRNGVNTEVIVADNDSTDATGNVACSFGARVVAEPTHNIARVRNCGAAAARGKVLVFVDADTHIPEELLVRIHQVSAAPGCLAGAVDTEYRPKKPSIRVYLGLWRIFGRAFGMAEGATQFYLRDTFTLLGGYDESLFMGEDVEFYARVRRHARHVGGSVRFIDELKVLPSCRRYDQWALWRTLIWTNPLVIAAMRHARSMWRGWYDAPLR